MDKNIYRSNLGLLNLSDTETIFTLDLLKDASVVSSKTLTLPAQTLQQLNGVLSFFFGTSGDGHTVKITGPEGAAYTAYLSTVDNRTGDAVYQSFSSQWSPTGKARGTLCYAPKVGDIPQADSSTASGRGFLGGGIKSEREAGDATAADTYRPG